MRRGQSTTATQHKRATAWRAWSNAHVHGGDNITRENILRAHRYDVSGIEEEVKLSRLSAAQHDALEAQSLQAPTSTIVSWSRTTLAIQPQRIQGLLEKQRKESAIRIDKLEQALSEIRKEYNEVWHARYLRTEDRYERTTANELADAVFSPSLCMDCLLM